MNSFKQRLQIKQLPNTTYEKEVISQYKKKEAEKYQQFYTNKNIQEYFHYLIATIMIEHNKCYKYHGINIPYRFKSDTSILNKLKEYEKKAKVLYTDKQDTIIDFKPVFDGFAMKVISRRRPPAFSSTDPEIKKLIEEKKKNQLFLEKMQDFKSCLITDEYTDPSNYEYKYDCSAIKYYEKCKEILLESKKIVDPKAINVIANYNKKIDDIDSRLDFLYAMNSPEDSEQKVTYDDLTEKNLNFFEILSEYENSVYNKSDLAILTKQFMSIFKNNKTFTKLGISLSKTPSKKKRTENGFESNFVYIDTIFGTIECQLQTEDQYRYGNYGYAAHTKLKGKAIKPLLIPDVKDREAINEFIKEVKKISPKGFFARMDDNESGRVTIQEFSIYQNYKNLISQVTKGDPREKYIYRYFDKLYALRNKIFKNKENSLGFIDYDIEQYTNSNKFKKLENVAMKNIDKQRSR